MFRLHLNRIILIGQVTEKPILRYVPSGNPICSFSIQVLRENLNTASADEEYDVFPVVAWKEQALYCSQSIEKGSWVYGEGALQIRTFGEAIQKKTTVEVILKDIFRLQQ